MLLVHQIAIEKKEQIRKRVDAYYELPNRVETHINITIVLTIYRSQVKETPSPPTIHQPLAKSETRNFYLAFLYKKKKGDNASWILYEVDDRGKQKGPHCAFKSEANIRTSFFCWRTLHIWFCSVCGIPRSFTICCLCDCLTDLQRSNKSSFSVS